MKSYQYLIQDLTIPFASELIQVFVCQCTRLQSLSIFDNHWIKPSATALIHPVSFAVLTEIYFFSVTGYWRRKMVEAFRLIKAPNLTRFLWVMHH